MLENNDLEVLETLVEWMLEKKNVWLATVTKTWGSSPRPIGSTFCCNEDGKTMGSLSGGCVEEDLVDKIIEKQVADNEPEVILYGKTKEEVYFRCSSKKNDIRDIWEKYFDPYVHLNIRTLGLNFLEIECLTTNKTDHKLTEQIDETSQPGKVFRLKHFYKSDHWSQNDIIKSKNRYFIPVHSLPFPNNTFKHSIKIQ